MIDVNSAFEPLSKTSVLGGGQTEFRAAKTKAGKPKNFAVEIESDRMYVSLDAREANKTFGAQLQAILAKQIESVKEDVSASTLRRRERDYNMERRGNATRRHRKRFAGGRIGAVPPNDPGSGARWRKKFNQSGRMRFTTVRPRQRSSSVSTATINFPANRLDPRTTDRVDGIIADAKRLIPMLGGKTSDPQQRKDFEDLMQAHAEAATATSDAELQRKRAELRKIQVDIVKQIARAVAS